MSTLQILMLIAVFLIITFGSFIYFVATWDAENEQPVSSTAPTSYLAFFKILPPEAQVFVENLSHHDFSRKISAPQKGSIV